MVNAARKSRDRGRLPSADKSGRVHADLVNSGQDTRITLYDGSTIVLKGVTQLEAVFSPDIYRSAAVIDIAVGGATSGAAMRQASSLKGA